MGFEIKKWMYAAENNAQGHNVIVFCPSCDLRLGCTHTIDVQGNLSPSLVCTHDGCSFHEFVQLAGYPVEPNVSS